MPRRNRVCLRADDEEWEKIQEKHQEASPPRPMARWIRETILGAEPEPEGGYTAHLRRQRDRLASERREVTSALGLPESASVDQVQSAIEALRG